jgi:calcineurin-like phosphoesterase family protein
MNSKIWFSADTHYSHANVLHLCDRQFSDIYEHDKILIQNHNQLVSPNDDYFFLGDFAYRCSPERVTEILKKLSGRIHIVIGNHDKPLIQAAERGLLNDMLNKNKLVIFGLNAIMEDHTIGITKMINIDGQLVFLSHYGLRTWPSAFRNSYHLYGHSHSRLHPLYKSMDVGVDVETSTHKRFFPWSYEEIKEEMEKVIEPFSEDPEQTSPDHRDSEEN